MKNILQHLEELGIVLRRNLSNVVTSVRFRLTLGFVFLFACTMVLVDITISYVRSFLVLRNLEDTNVLLEQGNAIREAFLHTMEVARNVDYIIYFVLLVLFTVISYKVSGFMLRPVTRALDAHQRFIRNANHELRTPITIATTALELALKKNIDSADPALVHAAHTALAEVRTIEEMLKNLNLISYIYAGQAPTKSRLDLITAVTHTVERLALLAKERGVTIDLLTHDGPIYVHAHEAAVGQIISNIIINAIKYTPHGGSVQICVFCEGKFASCVIHDTGIGLTSDELGSLFEPFFRSSRVQHIEGTGLGLAVVHELVRLNDGRLAVASTPNDGSAFTIRFRHV